MDSKLPKISRLKPPSVNPPMPQRLPIISESESQTTSKYATGFKSNLPRLPRSKSPPPMGQNIPRRILRRSVSMHEIQLPKSTLFKKSVKPQTTSRIATKMTAQPSTSRTGTKRAAPSAAQNEPAPKHKVAKIPDWDYKRRFQALLEKHTKVQQERDKLMEQIEGTNKLQEAYNNLKYEHSVLEKKCKELHADNKNLTEKLHELNEVDALNKDLETKNIEMTSKMEDLSKENVEFKDSRDKNIAEVDRLTSALGRLNEDYLKLQVVRRDLNNQVQSLKGNIRVYCKVRPAIGEFEQQRQLMITSPDEKSIVIRSQKESVSSFSGKAAESKQEFTFDYVFTQEATQSKFFEEIAPLVQSAIDGYHVCVFAYGQTGSGKTYTMQGLDNIEHIGMIPRTVDLIFDKIKSLCLTGWIYEAKASFLEIYNENLRDLLDPAGNHNLDIHFNEGKGITVTNLKIVPISSYQEFEGYMKLSHKNRMVAATDFNEHSSRSHAITKIYVSGTNLKTNTTYNGSIHLVDLAGSESARTSHAERLVETKNINKSLSTLGSVMLALHNKDKHIPFRNSKLTYLLQSCLGGNSKTLMIVNISPCEENLGETLNSLRFASTVKKVKTKITRSKGTLPLSAIHPSGSNA